MADFELTIVTPGGPGFSGPVTALVAPGREGLLGILAHHAPLIAALRRGLLKVEPAGGEPTRYFVLGEGLLEVSADNRVTVLTASAVAAKDLAAAEAQLDATPLAPR